MAKKDKKKNASSTIAVNKKARHDYFIEETYEAGLALEGWEVKSLRAGKANIRDAWVKILNNEAWLIGALITPLITASTDQHHDPTRTRKLLLHRREIDRLRGKIEQQGYTLVPLQLYWKRGKVKLEFGLAKGKKLHDKRATLKERDWQRQKQRLLKSAY